MLRQQTFLIFMNQIFQFMIFIVWPSSVTLIFNLPEQMFQVNNCAKLFWNSCINVKLWPRQAQFMIILSFELQVWPWPSTDWNKCFKCHFCFSRRTTVPNYFEIQAKKVAVMARTNLDGCMQQHIHTPNWNCNNYVSLTASRLGKNYEIPFQNLYLYEIQRFFHASSELLNWTFLTLQPWRIFIVNVQIHR